MTTSNSYREARAFLDKKNITPSEFHIMYEVDCYLDTDLDDRDSILERITPYLYDNWLDMSGATIEEVVEDAMYNLDELLRKLNLNKTMPNLNNAKHIKKEHVFKESEKVIQNDQDYQPD